MTPDLTVLLLSLLVLALVFAALAWWLWRNKEHIRFYYGFTENRRPRSTKSLLSLLVEPDYSTVWGTDHSDWDGNVDFRTTKALGSRFVFIKAMEGTVASRYYVPNTLAAKATGLLAAPYHWLHKNSNVSCKLQALKVWERTSPYTTALPLMLDFEWTRYMGQQANPTYTDLDIFVTEYTRLSGVKPLLYSAAGYMNQFGKIPDWLLKKFSGLVIASYGGLTLPIGITTYEFHQFTDEGDAEKISPNDAGKKEVDLIKFNGTVFQFTQRYGGDPDDTPIPDDEEPMTITYTGKVKDTATVNPRVRVQADTAASVVTTLPPGTAFTATGSKVTNDGFDWLNITANLGGGLVARGWLALTSNIEYQAVAPSGDFPYRIAAVETTIHAVDKDGTKWRATIGVNVADPVEFVRE